MLRTPVTAVIKKAIHANSLEEDLLVTEEPLEIRLGFGSVEDRKEERISVTMRTPGSDHELAIGFLFTEGIIPNYESIIRVEYCEQVKPEERGNVIRVELMPELDLNPEKWKRNFYTTSSCGVCGKSSLDAVEITCKPVPASSEEVDIELIVDLPNSMREAQTVFDHTGGIHAAALFDMHGELLLIHEDVGRHNAVDKVIGDLLRENLSNKNRILVVSGRAGFELVQKAAVAGIGTMVSVGAPSSLSVDLAKKRKMTLYGFVRKGQANRYTRIEEHG